MKRKLLEHVYSVFFVGALLLIAAALLHHEPPSQPEPSDPLLRILAGIQSLKPERPLHRTFLKESLDVFYPDQSPRNDSLIQSLVAWRRESYLAEIEALRHPQGLTTKKLAECLSMYGVFIAAFLIVIVMIDYGSITLGTFQFIQSRLQRPTAGTQLSEAFQILFKKIPGHRNKALLTAVKICGKGFLKILVVSILFSPAYVVAYSFKTNFETNSVLFLVLLGCFTNGILITYAYKFFSLLTAESRKGYVETARVKNLSSDYHTFTLRSLLHPKKYFDRHVLQHIFINARFQYRLTIKEQASFVITGLIIIEMALNIQGHLGYELLKSLLYRDWEVALAIVFGLFLLVKVSEAVADIRHVYETNKFENKGV